MLLVAAKPLKGREGETEAVSEAAVPAGQEGGAGGKPWWKKVRSSSLSQDKCMLFYKQMRVLLVDSCHVLSILESKSEKRLSDVCSKCNCIAHRCSCLRGCCTGDKTRQQQLDFRICKAVSHCGL